MSLLSAEKQNKILVFGFMVKNDLARGSGLFVTHEGVTLNHHFLLPPDGSDFKFLEGEYKLKVFAKLVNDSNPMLLFTIPLVVTHLHAEALKQKYAGLFFDWGPDQGNYYSHVEIKSEPEFDELIEIMANKKIQPTQKPRG